MRLDRDHSAARDRRRALHPGAPPVARRAQEHRGRPRVPRRAVRGWLGAAGLNLPNLRGALYARRAQTEPERAARCPLHPPHVGPLDGNPDEPCVSRPLLVPRGRVPAAVCRVCGPDGAELRVHSRHRHRVRAASDEAHGHIRDGVHGMESWGEVRVRGLHDRRAPQGSGRPAHAGGRRRGYRGDEPVQHALPWRRDVQVCEVHLDEVAQERDGAQDGA
mmetsp:Transcript_13486/g.35104  ORF Transcript_13486/g.35104 Transcript_13486/m.35104 type:complete len:219 (-) Transcript_13486:346-1002(-)